MRWEDLTLGQYQSLVPILEQEGTDLDKLVQMIACITKKSEDEIDSWPLQDLNKYRFLFNLDFNKRCPKYFRANGNWYKFNYEVNKMPAARYIEAKTFQQDGLVANMHKILASCVIPCKKTLIGYSLLSYVASDHEKYANDMKLAPFPIAYNASLFFCLLFSKLIDSTQIYLMEELMKVMSKEKAKEFTESLISTMDGFILPKGLQILKE